MSLLKRALFAQSSAVEEDILVDEEGVLYYDALEVSVLLMEGSSAAMWLFKGREGWLKNGVVMLICRPSCIQMLAQMVVFGARIQR